MAPIGNRIATHLGQRLRRKFPHRLFFLHIPKCGGTSIVEALSDCYGPRSLDPSQWYLDAPAVFEAATARNQHFQQISETVLLYAMAQRKHRFITGHFFFSDRAQELYGDRWETITVLRDPVSRWFSQYYFNRYKSGAHYKTDASLDAYIDSEEGVGAGRTLMNLLAGTRYDWADAPQEGVRRAIANLERIHLVGCLEHLDQFQSSFRARYGVGLTIGRRRKNPAAGQKSAPPDDHVLEKVTHICRYDDQIYRHALGMIGRPTAAAQP
ncbi:MAG: sulfotransferase family 2 domain-containing protein [Desulfosarcinaceae bacterium]|nr:sulfotransferase family 2 domain-containing protein [Desulfosarcinaceae bacterium]